MTLLTWDIYEVSSNSSPLNGVMLRGRLRKFSIRHSINLLTENTEDRENSVRFALLADSDPDAIITYITRIIPDARIIKVANGITNPVLSKMKVNIAERYRL